MIKKIDSKEIDEVVASGISVIKFSAGWCAACKAIQPAIVDLAEKNQDIKFYEMDADDNTDYVLGLGIKSLPSYQFYRDGKLLASGKGLKPMDILNHIDLIKEF